MWEFLKKIFFDRYREYRVDVYPEEHPKESRSFHIQKSDPAWLFGIFLLMSILFSTLLFYTPLVENIFDARFETAFLEEVFELTQRVEALQDSLVARDLQLNDLKNVVRTVPDTTFEIEPGSVPGEKAVERLGRQPDSRIPPHDARNRYEILNQA